MLAVLLSVERTKNANEIESQMNRNGNGITDDVTWMKRMFLSRQCIATHLNKYTVCK